MPVSKIPFIVVRDVGFPIYQRPILVDKSRPNQIPRDTGVAKFQLEAGLTPTTRTEHFLVVRARSIDARAGTIRMRLEPLAYNGPGLDQFNRANVDPLDGNWFTPINIAGISGAANLSANTITGRATNAFWRDRSGPECESRVKMSGLPAAGQGPVYCYVRMTTPDSLSDGYSSDLRITGGGVHTTRILRFDDGNGTELTSRTDITWLAGDELGCRAMGSTIKLFRKSAGTITELLSTDDVTYPGMGYVGFGMTDQNAVLDDFGGGNAFLETSVLSDSFDTYYLPLDDVHAAAILDYADLEIWLWGHSVYGDGVTFEVADVWLATPEGIISAVSHFPYIGHAGYFPTG